MFEHMLIETSKANFRSRKKVLLLEPWEGNRSKGFRIAFLKSGYLLT